MSEGVEAVSAEKWREETAHIKRWHLVGPPGRRTACGVEPEWSKEGITNTRDRITCAGCLAAKR